MNPDPPSDPKLFAIYDDRIAPGVRTWFAIVAMCCAAVTGGIYAYASFAGPFVEQLDRNLGEVLAREARSIASSGDTAGAIAHYRLALEKPFVDPQQRIWAMRHLGDLLIEGGETHAAAETLDEVVRLAPTDLIARGLLCDALAKKGEHDALFEAARAWLVEAKRQASAANIAMANYRIGIVYEARGQLEEAAATYLAGHAADPGNRNAYHAAAVLHRLGRDGEAVPLLESAIQHAAGWRLESAQALYADIVKTP